MARQLRQCDVNNAPLVYNKVDPVSYTHLDVYKRQLWHSAPETHHSRTLAGRLGSQSTPAVLNTHDRRTRGSTYGLFATIKGLTFVKSPSFLTMPNNSPNLVSVVIRNRSVVPPFLHQPRREFFKTSVFKGFLNLRIIAEK